MAIRVLLDHGVRQDHIVFVTFLVARAGGVSVLRQAFPEVKIVCAAVDEEMSEAWLEGYKHEGNPEGLGRTVWIMQPGMGHIGSCPLVWSCGSMKLIHEHRGSLLPLDSHAMLMLVLKCRSFTVSASLDLPGSGFCSA